MPYAKVYCEQCSKDVRADEPPKECTHIMKPYDLMINVGKRIGFYIQEKQ